MESATNAEYDRTVGHATTPQDSNREIPRARILAFASVLTVTLLACSWFVGATWARLSGESGLAWRLAPTLAALAFVPVTLAGRSWRHPLLKVLTVPAAVAVGAFSFALMAAIGSWIGVGFSALLGSPVSSRAIAFACFGAAAVGVIYGLANAAWLRVTRVTVALPNLPAIWEGRTAALVTDVHLGNIRGEGFVRRIVARLAELKPDAVFIAGDMFDGTAIDHSAAAQPWSKLAAPAGVYFVTGNHDEFADRTAVLDALRSTGIQVLNNAKVTVRGLQLVGVHDDEASDPRRFREILSLAGLNREEPSLLLTHQPANLAIPEEAGISLQLSGHTHGGQFWPWSAFVSRIYGPFAYGLNRFRKLLVLTSSGAGTWGPPLRVGTRSEIVLITFASVHSSNR